MESSSFDLILIIESRPFKITQICLRYSAVQVVKIALNVCFSVSYYIMYSMHTILIDSTN